MAQQENKPAKALEWLKWSIIWLGFAAIVAGNIHYQHVSSYIRVSVIIVAAILLLLFSLTTQKGASSWQFFKDSKSEVRKVVWPTRQETIQTALVVTVIVAIFSIFIWIVDSAFSSLVGAILFK